MDIPVPHWSDPVTAIGGHEESHSDTTSHGHPLGSVVVFDSTRHRLMRVSIGFYVQPNCPPWIDSGFAFTYAGWVSPAADFSGGLIVKDHTRGYAGQ